MTGRASRYFGVRTPGEVAAFVFLNLVGTFAAIVCFTNSGQTSLIGGFVVIAMVLGGMAVSGISSWRMRRRETGTARVDHS